ncbi:Molybdenum transport ATP-binding protein ModC [Vibrio cholerae]|nr:Molybdenum transport ATP-binding protein ModC [Vibrio cholerae]
MFQDARLFPHYTVRGNLNYGVTHADPEYFASVTRLLALERSLRVIPAIFPAAKSSAWRLGERCCQNPIYC